MKKVRENLSRLSFSEFKLATNKTLGYDIGLPRVKLKMMCTQYCSFLDWFQALRLSSGDGIVPDWRVVNVDRNAPIGAYW